MSGLVADWASLPSLLSVALVSLVLLIVLLALALRAWHVERRQQFERLEAWDALLVEIEAEARKARLASDSLRSAILLVASHLGVPESQVRAKIDGG